MNNAFRKMYKDHGKIFNVASLLLVVFLVLWIIGPAILPKVIAHVIGVITAVLIIASAAFYIGTFYVYAKNDPDVAKAKAPAWRILLLVILLLFALASPWWVTRIFH